MDISVPLGVAAAIAQSSIYDVPGGFRAVMFDRFSGVKDKVSKFMVIARDMERSVDRPATKARISWFHGYSVPYCMTVVSSHGCVIFSHWVINCELTRM